MPETNKITSCPQCGGQMKYDSSITLPFRFEGKAIAIQDITGYKCTVCGEVLMSAKEVKRIDRIVRALAQSSPRIIGPDSLLNLEETAKILRVTQQTVRNMIRDKRIDAHKVGREWRFLYKDVEAVALNGTSPKNKK